MRLFNTKILDAIKKKNVTTFESLVFVVLNNEKC